MDMCRYVEDDNSMASATSDNVPVFLNYVVIVISTDSEIRQNKLFIITKFSLNMVHFLIS
jgi:hypothetical protein